MTTYSQEQFDALINQVRAGDQDAASQLLENFEPQIRRVVRLRLTDARLRRSFDSMDVCQSVFANFFCRLSLGEFDITDPGQLVALLSTFARNKIISRHRKEVVRQPRNGKQIFYGDLASKFDVSDNQLTPSQNVEKKELLAKFEEKLSDEELQIASFRRQGLSWSDISGQLGLPADTLRKRLSRACDRIMSELELDQ